MSIILASAKRIAADLGTMGSQRLIDAERDLGTLRDAARLFVRQGLDGASPDDARRIDDIIDGIDDHLQAWIGRVTDFVERRHPGLNLDWVSGSDGVERLMRRELENLPADGRVEITIADVEHMTRGSRVRLDGDGLTIDDWTGDEILRLPLEDVAAFGAVGVDGSTGGWSGFDLLTLDHRLVSLR